MEGIKLLAVSDEADASTADDTAELDASNEDKIGWNSPWAEVRNGDTNKVIELGSSEEETKEGDTPSPEETSAIRARDHFG